MIASRERQSAEGTYRHGEGTTRRLWDADEGTSNRGVCARYCNTRAAFLAPPPRRSKFYYHLGSKVWPNSRCATISLACLRSTISHSASSSLSLPTTNTRQFPKAGIQFLLPTTWESVSKIAPWTIPRTGVSFSYNNFGDIRVIRMNIFLSLCPFFLHSTWFSQFFSCIFGSLLVLGDTSLAHLLISPHAQKHKDTYYYYSSRAGEHKTNDPTQINGVPRANADDEEGAGRALGGAPRGDVEQGKRRELLLVSFPPPPSSSSSL
jgi:hypothetical protein